MKRKLFALILLSFRGREIVNVTAFLIRSTESKDPEAYERHPEQPFDERLLAGAFWRFGLPERL